ncbi:hypothetical protein TNCV_1007241 [Trichonephila clavipes]|nr:hypothetical protein TNCV_1007241 [Trichonephila clavipes]
MHAKSDQAQSPPVGMGQNQAVFARRRIEMKLKLELVEEKQKLLDIREKRRTREVREQALPPEYHRQTYL